MSVNLYPEQIGVPLAEVQTFRKLLGGSATNVARRSRAGVADPNRLDASFLFLVPGFDPQFGARPLRRTIQRRVENELSRLVLGGAVQPATR